MITAIINVFKFLYEPERKVVNEGTQVHCYCLGLDVVEYSKRTTDVQYRINLKLRDIAKSSFITKVINSDALIFLPTGDGMIVALLGSEHSPLIMIQIAQEIQEKIKDHNRTAELEERFSVRIGLHSGTGIVYTDINNRANLAGTVVNMTQRVMDFGEEWHILASKNAYDDIASLDKTVKKYFHSIGYGDVKHKITMEFYNVFCENETKFGNSVRPIGIKQNYRKVTTSQTTSNESREK